MSLEVGFILLLMCLGTQGDSILSAHLHIPMERNVRLPVPLFTATAQLLIERRRDHVIIAGKVDQGDLERHSPLIAEELKIYSEAMRFKSQVKQIVFCNTIYAGTPLSFRRCGGLAVYQHHSMLLNASSSSDYLPLAFHHEFFHFLDWQMHFADNDPEWAGLNEPQFRYVGYNRAFTLGSSDKNFISAYSQAAMVEDKAEIYAHLITNPQGIADRAKHSQVLQRKIDCLKRRLQQFCPEFNHDFWSAAEIRVLASWLSRSNTTTPECARKRMSKLLDSGGNTEIYRAPIVVHAPPMSDAMKVICFVSLMLLPWIIMTLVSLTFSRLRASKLPSERVDTQQ